jgi:hypothetical protein
VTTLKQKTLKQKTLIAAGLLCLGASPAFAYALPAMAPDMAKAVKSLWTDQMAAEQPGVFDTGEAKAPKAQGAAADAYDAASADKPVVETAALGDLSVKPDLAAAESGPSEAVMQPTPLPAAAAYPPCRRGGGDDHCIQLYEPGVRAQLADWNRAAAGSETAMGGPYEPVDTTLAGELGGAGSMNGDGLIDRAAGETADAAMPAGAQYTGMGGPLEEVDYPPCSRAVTDRCIQLYERGAHR